MSHILRVLNLFVGCICFAGMTLSQVQAQEAGSVFPAKIAAAPSSEQTFSEQTFSEHASSEHASFEPTASEQADSDYVLLKVEGTYVDFYTGPGFGYPNHYSAKRGEILEILRRRTSWYRVKAENGTEGWVEETQLSSLKLVHGQGQDFKETVLEDFYDARFEVSVFVGGLSNDTQLNGRLGYKLSDFLEVEAFYGQAFNEFADTRFYGVGIQGKPIRGHRWEPYLGLSMGELENDPNSTVIGGQTTTDDITMAQLGLRFYFTRNFVVRAEYGRMLLHVDDDRRDDLDLVSIGIGAFF